MNAPAAMTMTASAVWHEPIIIRASALTYWPDCERRAAARLFRPIIEAHGYQLRTTTLHIGAPIGTGAHAGAAHGLQSKIDFGFLAPVDEQIDVAIAALDEAMKEANDEIEWPENVARNRNEAQEQVIRMTRMIDAEVSPHIKPAAVEDRLTVDIGDGFILSGQRDIYGIEEAPLEPGLTAIRPGWRIKDLKTGAHQGSHLAQTGAYSILGRSHGQQVDGADIIWLRRAPLDDPQPHPVFLPVDIEEAEQSAEATYRRAKSGLLQFLQTGNPHVFLANPVSKMCNKTCSAYGTRFCRAHLGKDYDG